MVLGRGGEGARARKGADLPLSRAYWGWTRKYGINTEVYGCGEASWEAQGVPRTEAFGFFCEQELFHRSDGDGRILSP